MKMYMVVYHEAADESVVGEFKKAGIKGYTKMKEARGEGTETEPKLGTHCWPGRNNVLLMAVEGEIAPRVDAIIRKLKKDHPRAGVKGFVLPVNGSI